MTWKHDQDKPPVHLLPYDVLLEIAKVYDYGRKKYPEREGRTWEDGWEWHRPFSASMRHLWAVWQGEDLDPESGLPHLSHAAFNVFCLLRYQLRKIGVDNRPVIKLSDVQPSTNGNPSGDALADYVPTDIKGERPIEGEAESVLS